MLGSFAVGKTSLVRRFLTGGFDEKYLSTIGVKVHEKAVEIEQDQITLVVWDIHGEDDFQLLRKSYLRGMSGYFLVADGTRPQTLTTAIALHDFAQDAVGVLPFSLLINKCDLQDSWKLNTEDLVILKKQSWSIVETSAKTGAAVEDVFRDLVVRMVG